jgi:hypothetical protein
MELYSGGKDGLILKWTAAGSKTIVFDINKVYPDHHGITAFDFSGKSGNLLVGCKGAAVIEQKGKNTPQIINQGHF